MKTIFFTTFHLLLLTLASFFGVGLFYQVMSAGLDPSVIPAAPARAATRPAATQGVRPLSEYDAITRRNLFHTADPNKAPQAPKAVDLAALQETKLDLKLWGTLVLNDGRGSYAVIEDKQAGGQNLYRVGDKVQEALIKMILRERVVLDVGGKDEILQIEELAAVSGADRVVSVRTPAEPSSSPEPPQPVARDVNLSRQTIEEAMGNVAELMKQVRIRPFFEGGKPAGLSLAGVAAGSIFEQMGIRNGDVLQAVDGQPIQTVDDIVNLYQSLSSAENIAIQVRRGGRIEDIQYKIE